MIDLRKSPNPPIFKGEPIWTYMVLSWIFLGIGLFTLGMLLIYMTARLMGMPINDDAALVVAGLVVMPVVCLFTGIRLLGRANQELCRLREDHLKQLKVYEVKS